MPWRYLKYAQYAGRLPMTLQAGSSCSILAILAGRERAGSVLQHIRDVKDPEHPYSLEQLDVVHENLITVDDSKGHVR